MSVAGSGEVLAGRPQPRPAATADELFRLRLSYCLGQGAPRDPVMTHLLFNLDAARGSVQAKICLKELSEEMDPTDLAEAQRAARKWLVHAKSSSVFGDARLFAA